MKRLTALFLVMLPATNAIAEENLRHPLDSPEDLEAEGKR